MKRAKMMKVLFSLLLAASMLLATLSIAVAEDVTPLKFLTVAGKEAGFDAVVARWNELHPEAPVEVEYYSQAPLFEVIASSQGIGSTDYDILAVDTPKVGEYGKNGWTLNMNDYVGSVIDASAFQTPALNACYYDGSLTCLPLTAGISLLYYNKTLIEQAGIELKEITPDNRLTFEEMEEICQKVLDTVDPNRDQGYDGIAFSQPNVVYQMLQLPTSLGGATLVDDQDLSSTLNTDAWRNAALYYQKLINSGLSQSCLDMTFNSDNFFAGKTVFLLSSISMSKNLYNNPDVELRVTYNPVFADFGSAAAPTGSWAIGVSNFSKNPDQSVAFVNFLCAGEGHEIYIETLKAFSALQKDADALLANPDADYVQQIGAYEAANVACPRPVTPYYSTYETVVNEFWRNIASGTDVDQAIETAIETYSIYMQ